MRTTKPERNVQIKGYYEGVGLLLCPWCPKTNSLSDYNHLLEIRHVSGNDSYEAGWSGKGDLVVMVFGGECRHVWELCVGFDKGNQCMFTRHVYTCNHSQGHYFYAEYIESDGFRKRFQLAKESVGNRCQICNQSEKNIRLNPHHRTLEKIGAELPSDITVLCDPCLELAKKGVEINNSRPLLSYGFTE